MGGCDIYDINANLNSVVVEVEVWVELGNTGKGENYVPTVNDYVERNVRGVALVVTAKERNDLENKLSEV